MFPPRACRSAAPARQTGPLQPAQHRPKHQVQDKGQHDRQDDLGRRIEGAEHRQREQAAEKDRAQLDRRQRDGRLCRVVLGLRRGRVAQRGKGVANIQWSGPVPRQARTAKPMFRLPPRPACESKPIGEAPSSFGRYVDGISGHADGLEWRCACFETAALRSPQDEDIFVSAINNIPHAEERPRGRVSKHAGCPMQCLFTALSIVLQRSRNAGEGH